MNPTSIRLMLRHYTLSIFNIIIIMSESNTYYSIYVRENYFEQNFCLGKKFFVEQHFCKIKK